MSNPIEKTTKESLQIAARNMGQATQFVYTPEGRHYYSCDGEQCQILTTELQDIEFGRIESFRITSLRTLDEMTEEEKKTLKKLRSRIYLNTRYIYYDTAESIHYLESIGIDTMGINNKTILIKD